jgi:hypothetical protein
MEITAIARSAFGVVGERASIEVVKEVVGPIWCKLAEFKVR